MKYIVGDRIIYLSDTWTILEIQAVPYQLVNGVPPIGSTIKNTYSGEEQIVEIIYTSQEWAALTSAGWYLLPTTAYYVYRMQNAAGSIRTDWTDVVDGASELAPPQYSLTVTIYRQGNVTQSPTGTTFDPGTIVQLTAVAASGYKFDGWFKNGTAIGATNPLSVTMDADYVIVAVFSQQTQPPGGNKWGWVLAGGVLTTIALVALVKVKRGRAIPRFK